MGSPTQPRLVDSAAGAPINGAIAWSGFKSSATVPLSMDSIGAPGVTALGNAAAALLRMPFLPAGLRVALANTPLAFGAFVTAAVIWQRTIGTIEVGPARAAAVVALVTAIATAFAEWRTKTTMLALARAAG